MVRAVVGANWGDEGKGKITDMLADSADVVVRFQGGANAGHTIVNAYGKFALHTLPSGVFHSNITNVIGNGVALNIPVLMKELESIVSQGVPRPKLLISDRCQFIMPYHVLFDQYEEERLAGKSFGSTKSGIAPFYSDKYAKIGFQVADLFDEDRLRERLDRILVQKNILLEHLYHKPKMETDDLMQELTGYRALHRRYRFFPGKRNCRRKDHPPGRTAGNHERSGSRDLSDGHFFFHAGSLRRHRSGNCPLCHSGCDCSDQGVFLRRRCRGLRFGDFRRRGR